MVQPQRGLPEGKDQWRGAWNRQDEGGGIEGTCEKALGNTAEQAADWRIPASGSPSGGNTQGQGRGKNVGNTDRSGSTDSTGGSSSAESNFRKGLQ
jgi:hypothetical protein